MTFSRDRCACLSNTVRKRSIYWFAFSTDENSETLESSVIDDGWSMIAMFLPVLHMVEDFGNEALRQDLMQ